MTRNAKNVKRNQALRELYERGAHLFPFHVERDPSNPSSKRYVLPPGWQAARAPFDEVEGAPHVGFIVGSLELSGVDLDVKDGKDEVARQRLAIDRWRLVVEWAGCSTPAVEQTPTRGVHGYWKRTAPHPKRLIQLTGLPGKLEVFGDTGFVELFDPVRLLKHLDTLPVLPHDLSGADEVATRFANGRRGTKEGDRNQGLYDRCVAALANDPDPEPAIAAAVKDAKGAGLPFAEIDATVASARRSEAARQSGAVQGEGVADADSEIHFILQSWRKEVDGSAASQQMRISRNALGRLSSHVQGGEGDAVRTMRHLSNAWESGGDGAVRGYFERQVRSNVHEGIAWGASLEPDWLVPGWVTAFRLVFMFAVGGIGKSRLSVQLAVALAVGHPVWLPQAHAGAAPIVLDGVPRKVAYVSWEDTGQGMFRMVHSAAKSLGIEDVQAAVADRLSFFHVGAMGPLWSPGQEKHTSVVAGITEAGRWITRLMHEFDVVILDPLAAMYGSDENVRTLVRSFVTYWDNAAQAAKCTLLVLGHSSKKDLVSGSTDWENGVRCVIGVEWVERKEKDPEDKRKVRVADRALQLRAVKMNEAPKPDPRWLTPGPGGHGWRTTTWSDASS